MNDQIQHFQHVCMDARNRPTPIPNLDILSSDHSIKQKGIYNKYIFYNNIICHIMNSTLPSLYICTIIWAWKRIGLYIHCFHQGFIELYPELLRKFTIIMIHYPEWIIRYIYHYVFVHKFYVL